MNENDSERIAGVLSRQGMEVADAAASADVVVFNTCTIRENADNKLYGNLNSLREAKRERPGMQIVVAGCLAQAEGNQVFAKAPHVDVVVGTHRVGALWDLLMEARGGPMVDVGLDDDGADPLADLATSRESSAHAWVTIQAGCDNSCAFCIVPQVRGPERSRPFATVVTEVEALVVEGVSEVTLLGQNVNSYGRDLTRELRKSSLEESEWRSRMGDAYLEVGSVRRIRPLFAELLRAVGAVEGIRRVRFTSPHPKDMREETFAAMAEVPAVCESLHFPLQSGSDRVLAAMHRGYTAERFLAKLARAREVIPNLGVSTDIIVGFPGETEDDFAATLEVCAQAAFDSAYTFIYSPRPGTEAAGVPEKFVAPDVVSRRFGELTRVVERSARTNNEKRVGGEYEVLIEGESKRDPLYLTGRTRQNILVHFPRPAGSEDLAGRYGVCRITEGAAHYLKGELVDCEALADSLGS